MDYTLLCPSQKRAYKPIDLSFSCSYRALYMTCDISYVSYSKRLHIFDVYNLKCSLEQLLIMTIIILYQSPSKQSALFLTIGKHEAFS